MTRDPNEDPHRLTWLHRIPHYLGHYVGVYGFGTWLPAWVGASLVLRDPYQAATVAAVTTLVQVAYGLAAVIMMRKYNPEWLERLRRRL